jgi:cytochrome c553
VLKSRFSALLGTAAVFAVAATPADAADDIELAAQVCGACHGEHGEPQDKTTPVIWGQQQSYGVKQLHDYKSGDRANSIMSPMAEGIAQEDLRKMAAYFAAKSWPAKHASNASASPPNGIAICGACHQKNLEGGLSGPRLAGQSYEYLVASMRSFADGERTNNADMPQLMRQLTESEREAIAHYLSAL